ncbi:hypothetical protein [Spiroplasma sp. AdecLV25b]|uniref:hypothetical protein n=1 Tax=Spiroplasma sp. AdecLV25b TaxID=3027162 RepID=UPI0027E01319|nr:hypothetical protein [Spiroplasma sp. AdecLV25b]
MKWNTHYQVIAMTIMITSLFISLLLMLSIITKPQVIATSSQIIFINDSKYEQQGQFAYVVNFKKTNFTQMHTNKITIFLVSNNNYLTINFPQWINNEQFLVTKNMNDNTYANQPVLIMTQNESLFTFIWNNFTT